MSWRERSGRSWGRLGMKFNIWKDCPKVPITELLSFIVDNRGKTVPTADDGWKLIATNCVTNNTLFPVYEKVRYLTQETYETWFRAHPIPGDILFVNKGTPGRVCLVPDPVDFCIAQDMIALRADDEKIYNKYLFAVLRSREIQQQIYNTNVGDVIPHFKKQFMDQLLIPVPDRRIQEIIGNLYYELSYKTELNKKINNNLEQQAVVLFRSWFSAFSLSPNSPRVDSEFGEIPESFAVVKVGSLPMLITDYVANGSFASLKANVNLYQEPNYAYFIRNTDLKSGSYGVFVDQHSYEFLSKSTLYGGEIIISNVGDVGSVFLCPKLDGRMTLGNNIIMLRPQDDHLRYYLYIWFKYLQGQALIQGIKGGSAQPKFNKTDFKNTSVLIPPKDILTRFHETVAPMFEMISQRQAETARLTDLRDTLLPQLMSGEIDVSSLDL